MADYKQAGLGVGEGALKDAEKSMYDIISKTQARLEKMDQRLANRRRKLQELEQTEIGRFLSKNRNKVFKNLKDEASFKSKVRKLEEKERSKLIRQERLEGLKGKFQKVTGEGSFIGKTRTGVQAASMGGGMGGIASMAKSGGPWAIAIAAVLAIITKMVDQTNKLSSNFASASIAVGDIGKAAKELDLEGQVRRMKNINKIAQSWNSTQNEIQEEMTALAKTSGFTSAEIEANVKGTNNSLFTTAKAMAMTFNTDTSTMMQTYKYNLGNMNMGINETNEALMSIMKTSKGLNQTLEESFSQLRDINTQFVHLGDQTKNYLVLANALKDVGMPKSLRTQNINGIISGFENMSTSLKILMSGDTGLGGFFKFHKMLRSGDLEGLTKGFTKLVSATTGFKGIDKERVLKVARGEGGTNADVMMAKTVLDKFNLVFGNKSLEENIKLMEAFLPDALGKSPMAEYTKQQRDALMTSLKKTEDPMKELISQNKLINKRSKSIFDLGKTFMENKFQALLNTVSSIQVLLKKWLPRKPIESTVSPEVIKSMKSAKNIRSLVTPDLKRYETLKTTKVTGSVFKNLGLLKELFMLQRRIKNYQTNLNYNVDLSKEEKDALIRAFANALSKSRPAKRNVKAND